MLMPSQFIAISSALELYTANC